MGETRTHNHPDLLMTQDLSRCGFCSDSRHLNDRSVRDADKLWRYEVAGTSVGCDWFGETPAQNCARNDRNLPRFEIEPWRAMAVAAFAETRRALMLHFL